MEEQHDVVGVYCPTGCGEGGLGKGKTAAKLGVQVAHKLMKYVHSFGPFEEMSLGSHVRNLAGEY